MGTLMTPATAKAPTCGCGKPVKFLSSLLGTGFCSDDCFEQAQMANKSAEDAHIIRTRTGAFFRQGDLRFSVDAKDLNNVVGANGGDNVIDKLMDSQIVALAGANALPHDPYVRELLRPVLTGLVQMVWYRDLQNHDSDHLRTNQSRRVVLYHQKLRDYENPPERTRPMSGKELAATFPPKGRNHVRSTAGKTSMLNKSYRVKPGKHESVASGREEALLGVLKTLKTASFSQIVEAAQGKVQTKQDFETIIARFLKELIAHGAVEEV